MREIIEIDRDFNLGTEKCTKKTKPLSNTRNRVTVSLFDENGKTREIKTENKVMEWYKEDAYYRHYEKMLGQNEAVDGHFKNPLNYLILSDKDDDEANVNCMSGYGNIIGYAQRKTPYSGSSTTQGTYNINESSISIKDGNLICHEVYDFPTHASNGEIKSMMWAPNSTDSQKYEMFSASSNSSTSVYSSRDIFANFDILNRRVSFISNWKLCTSNLLTNENVITSNAIKISEVGHRFPISTSKVNYSLQVLSESEVLVSITNTTSSMYADIPARTYKEYIYNAISDEIKDVYSIGIPSMALSDSNGYTYSIYKMVRHNGYLYAVLDNTSTNGIAKFDLSGNLIKSLSNIAYYGSSSNPRTLFNKNNLLGFYTYKQPKGSSYSQQHLLLIDEDLNIISETLETSTNGQLISNLKDISTIEYTSSSPARNYMSIYKLPFTTYLKLSSPVVKTNTNTMKVQYDFVIEANKFMETVLL